MIVTGNCINYCMKQMTWQVGHKPDAWVILMDNALKPDIGSKMTLR